MGNADPESPKDDQSPKNRMSILVRRKSSLESQSSASASPKNLPRRAAPKPLPQVFGLPVELWGVITGFLNPVSAAAPMRSLSLSCRTMHRIVSSEVVLRACFEVTATVIARQRVHLGGTTPAAARASAAVVEDTPESLAAQVVRDLDRNGGYPRGMLEGSVSNALSPSTSLTLSVSTDQASGSTSPSKSGTFDTSEAGLLAMPFRPWLKHGPKPSGATPPSSNGTSLAMSAATNGNSTSMTKSTNFAAVSCAMRAPARYWELLWRHAALFATLRCCLCSRQQRDGWGSAHVNTTSPGALSLVCQGCLAAHFTRIDSRSRTRLADRHRAPDGTKLPLVLALHGRTTYVLSASADRAAASAAPRDPLGLMAFAVA